MIIFKSNINNCTITKEDTHIKTIRPKEGDILRLTDLKGTIATVKIINYDFKNGIGAYIIVEQVKSEPLPGKVLIQAIIDKNYLDKLCELLPINNITHLTLVQSDYSNSTNINIDRLKLILIRSCEQSENPYLPTIEVIDKIKLTQYLESNNIMGTVLELPTKNIKPSLTKMDTIIVGPEGGFSDSEIKFFEDKQYPFYSIKCNVLPAWLAGYSYFLQ